jgi:hypothetical protein
LRLGTNSTQLGTSVNTPQRLVVETKLPTHYILAKNIVDLSVWKYNKTRRGITFEDLLTKGLAKHKRQAQDCLKYHLRKGNIFTPSKRRPQEYFATCIRSKIMEKTATSTPMDPTGIASSKSVHPLSNCIEPLVIQTLEGYVLPLLPRAPLYLHNLHFKLTITPQCYRELDLPGRGGNKYGKYLGEIIGTTGG